MSSSHRRPSGSINRLVASLSLLLCGMYVALAEKPSQEWSQWRGPTRDCRVSATKWPNSLKADHLKQRWQVELQPSYSGPIVVDYHVFVTETQNRETECVRALDRKTGREIWKTSWRGSMSVPFFAKANGDWIRATPAYSDERLYVAGMRDVLVCLNATDGAEIWRVDFVEKYGSPLPAFGFASSPLIFGKHVFVQAGGGVVKLDKLTGEIKWRNATDGGGMSGSAFSSPVVATLHDREQLVVQTRKKLMGLDLKSGEELWSIDVPAFRGMNIVTPTIVDDSVFTSSYGGGSFLFALERNRSRLSVSKRWRNKVQGYMSSPVVIGDFVYLHLRNQRFACIDLKTGKERWITKPFGKYWSIVVQDDRILALDERGDLLLIHANPEKFELLDSRHISDDPTWAHLAVRDDEVFVRTLKSQIAFEWNDELNSQRP